MTINRPLLRHVAAFVFLASGQLQAQTFESFLNELQATETSLRQAKVDSFLSAPRTYPYIENLTQVHFIYTGTATTITIPSDRNEWNTSAFPMTNVAGTTLWYYSMTLPSDARMAYKFFLDGSTWILDPRNPYTTPGGYGPDSELRMPNYQTPPEIKYWPDIPHGSLTSMDVFSQILQNSRSVKVYTPPGYESAPSDSFPVIFFHDGDSYLGVGEARNVLDYLFNKKTVMPLIGVFIPPVERDNEYAFDKTVQFSSFIISELVPMIDTLYRTKKDPAFRGMCGISWGGLIAGDICYAYPDQFGLVGMFSPSLWPQNERVRIAMSTGPVRPLKIYLDWGTLETSIQERAMLLRDSLLALGYPLKWREWDAGHDWVNWRQHLDEALEFLLPYQITSVKSEENIPRNFELLQNYPNPFNPSTTISYRLPFTVHCSLRIYDVLGRVIATLVDEVKPAGAYRAEWNASVTSGVYFIRMEVAGQNGNNVLATKKMTLLK